jgi:hypothetical protein
MDNRQRKKNNSGVRSGAGRFAPCIISILLLHAILVHLYILHLTDTIVLSNNSDSNGGRDKRDINEKLSSFLTQRPPREDKRHDNITHTTAINATTTTLVVYSGPNSKDYNMAKLYEKNCDYFLIHGIDCNSALTTDTVIVVGHDYYDEYLPRIQHINDKCRSIIGNSRDSIILVARRNVCYDMESARLALYGGVAGLRSISNYDYFVFVNCGMTGPSPPSTKWPGPWTTHFTRLLDDTVKMSGLTLNCEIFGGYEHIMSVVYALDRIGLDLIMKSGAIFDCLTNEDYLSLKRFRSQFFIDNYEMKMGTVILDAGYGLRPLIRHDKGMLITKENVGDCRPCKDVAKKDENKTDEDEKKENESLSPSCDERKYYEDIWIGSRLKFVYDGRIPSLEDVLFFKTSRYLSPEIAAQINFTGKVNWNWE